MQDALDFKGSEVWVTKKLTFLGALSCYFTHCHYEQHYLLSIIQSISLPNHPASVQVQKQGLFKAGSQTGHCVTCVRQGHGFGRLYFERVLSLTLLFPFVLKTCTSSKILSAEVSLYSFAKSAIAGNWYIYTSGTILTWGECDTKSPTSRWEFFWLNVKFLIIWTPKRTYVASGIKEVPYVKSQPFFPLEPAMRCFGTGSQNSFPCPENAICQKSRGFPTLTFTNGSRPRTLSSHVCASFQLSWNRARLLTRALTARAGRAHASKV